MKEILSEINKSSLGKGIFLVTLGASIFWIITKLVPIYENKIAGAVYEMLWLPVVVILFILPLFSFLLWAGEKFRVQSAHLFSIILAALAILVGYLLVN
jgi:hypothetical protein